MIKNIEMKWMLIISMLFAGLLPLVSTGFYALNEAENALHIKGFDQLKSLRTVKGNEIEHYFEQINNQIITLSEDQMTTEMMREAKARFYSFAADLQVNKSTLAEYKGDVRRFFESESGKKFAKETSETTAADQLMASSTVGIIAQYLYIADNKHPNGSKGQLDDTKDGSHYANVDGKLFILLDIENVLSVDELSLVGSIQSGIESAV